MEITLRDGRVRYSSEYHMLHQYVYQSIHHKYGGWHMTPKEDVVLLGARDWHITPQRHQIHGNYVKCTRVQDPRGLVDYVNHPANYVARGWHEGMA